MSWLSKWFDELLLKRVTGLLTRKILDWIVGALAASVCFGTELCTSLSEWIVQNMTQIEAFSLAAVVAVFTTLWSFNQKKEDVKKIKEKG